MLLFFLYYLAVINHVEIRYKSLFLTIALVLTWEFFSASLPGHNLPWFGSFPYTVNAKGDIQPLANLRVWDYSRGDYNYVWDEALFTATVGSFPENRLGLFDIIGNVAEYTADDKVKGGSWATTLEESVIDKVQDYPVPDPRVGFRLVMEIIEK